MGIPVYHNITLDMLRPNSEIVWAKQNDRLSRKIVAQLTAGGVAWTPPGSTLTAILRYRKPDGTGGYYDLDEAGNPAVVVDGSTVTLTLVEQALTVPGVVEYELDWYNNARRLTTFTFSVHVEPSVVSDATIISSDYFNALTARVTEASADIEAAMAIFSTARMHAPNLLDNGWFSVNQRGVTTLPYSAYCVDRWLTYRASGSITADGISVTDGNIFQKLEPALWESLIGKTLTVSVMLSTGTVKSDTVASFNGTSASFPTSNCSLGITDAGDYTLSVYTHGAIRAVKLEIGGVSTLANDVAPDYSQELVKCQRYFYRLENKASNRKNLGMCQIAATAQGVYFGIQLPVGLRHAITSTAGFTASAQTCIGASLTTGNNAIYSTSITFYDCWASNTKIILQAGFSAGALTQSAAYALFLAGNSYLDFSADL